MMDIPWPVAPYRVSLMIPAPPGAVLRPGTLWTHVCSHWTRRRADRCADRLNGCRAGRVRFVVVALRAGKGDR